MALSGLQIYKHLPKQNCKECGVPTCLAFAMKVAAGQGSLEECPRLDAKAKTELGEASAPPQQLVTLGAGEAAIQIGQETVLYRHDDKFYNPTALAECLNDQLDDAAIRAHCQAVRALSFDRLGKTVSVDMVAVMNVSNDAARFAAAAKSASQAWGKSMILMSPNLDALRAAGQAIQATRPLLWAMNTGADADGFIALAKELNLPLCVEAPSFEALAAIASKARDAGLKDLVLSPGVCEAGKGLAFLSQSRRAAIMKKFRPMGYPVAMVAMNGDPDTAAVDACWYTLKYAGIVVTNVMDPARVLAILATRGDIYTNPQVPVQVESGLHTVGDPGPDAPVLVTTNFALSYYSVESEVSSARIPAHILAVDTEGTSVLTAWAADKFNGQSIAQAIEKHGVAGKVKHKQVIIPGLVAVLSAAVEDESGWKVMVGPREASGISTFLKSQWKS